jgi:fatty acid desaturase
MGAVKALRPLDVFDKAEWQSLVTISNWRGLWLVAHAWIVIFTMLLGTAWLLQWNVFAGLAALPVTVAVIGGRQLGLSILMHDAAHGLLHPNRRINNFVGEWFTGAATGSDLKSYRTYHLTHHKYTQQPEDPDLPLSKPFPTSRASLRRKVIRDLTGQTFFKQRGVQFAKAWSGLRTLRLARAVPQESHGQRDVEAARRSINTIGRFVAVQTAVLIVGLATFGVMPFLIWLIALATSFQLFLRIRNIAEHPCPHDAG